MLLIKKLRYKNILSSGNQFTEIDFNLNSTTLIRGNSGQGKSLIITALIFGLYGKSNRGTVKKQLVNTVNKKDCLVEVEFSIDGKEYLIRRGIAPNIFQIYINDVLQDELSAVKDQQKYLEINILKMTYKTFMQVVVLGSNNYIPFMQLSAADRRDLVEELLDIKIFSTMSSILKTKVKNISLKLKEFEVAKTSTSEKIGMQRNFISQLKQNGLKLIEDKESRIEQLILNRDELDSNSQNLLTELEFVQTSLSEITFSSSSLNKFISLEGKLSQKLENLMKEREFFHSESTCPTCKQDLQVDFTQNKIKELNSEFETISSGHQELLLTIQEQEKNQSRVNEINSNISQLNSKLSNIRNETGIVNKQIRELEQEIDEIRHSLDTQSSEEATLLDLLKTHSKLEAQHKKAQEALYYFEFSNLLFRDDGVKAKIIKQYIPIINQQINKYLQLMDMYINFNLDEEFKENINTPLHEGFSYSSFSEGEKQRINLATILSWREICRLKNCANCNLIFFDETLDSSLDATGIDDFLKIINYVIVNSNIFVISHREGFEDKFQRVLEVKKVNGFSKILT